MKVWLRVADNNQNAEANGAGGIAVGENHDSPIATSGGKAIGSVNDDSAVGMDQRPSGEPSR